MMLKLLEIKMLSTKYRLELTDICCRMLTTDGVRVSLDERIWRNKLCEHNMSARDLRDSLLCPYISYPYNKIKLLVQK